MRFVLWLSKLAVTAVVISLCCLAVTFFAINSYVDLLLQQYQIPRSTAQKIDWNQFMAHLSKQFDTLTGAQAGAKATQERDVAVNGSKPDEKDKTGQTGNDSTTPAPKSSSTERKPPEDAVAVWSRQSGQSEAAPDDRKVVVSSDEFSKAKDELTQEEKTKIFSIISRLPASDMQIISKLMESGITASELKELEQLLQKHLQPEEYEELMNMLKKKGSS